MSNSIEKNPNYTKRRAVVAVAAGAAITAGALGTADLVHTTKHNITLSQHINDPSKISANEAVEFLAPHGSTASGLAAELAPDSKSDQAALQTEMGANLQSGQLVKVDKTFVETRPTDLTYVDPVTGERIVTATPTPTESVVLVPNGGSNGGHEARSPQPTESASLVPNGNDGGHVARAPH